MSEIELKFKEENKFINELFGLHEDGSCLKNLNENFVHILNNSKSDPKYFIGLLNYFSKCRPTQQHITKELIECVYSCFPLQINEIQKYIKEDTFFTQLPKFIIFPEEFPTKGNKEQNEMFLLLQRDDFDGFISFLSKNPTIDITKEQTVEIGGYYWYLFEQRTFIFLIDFCCLFGSLNCFKYLLLNQCEITEKTLQFSIAGGNQEIINILKENGHSFE